jgi:hypothetical protein
MNNKRRSRQQQGTASIYLSCAYPVERRQGPVTSLWMRLAAVHKQESPAFGATTPNMPCIRQHTPTHLDEVSACTVPPSLFLPGRPTTQRHPARYRRRRGPSRALPQACALAQPIDACSACRHLAAHALVAALHWRSPCSRSAHPQ